MQFFKSPSLLSAVKVDKIEKKTKCISPYFDIHFFRRYRKDINNVLNINIANER